MRQRRESTARVAADARIRVLAARSDAKGLAQLAGHLGALLCTGGLVSLAAEPVWLFASTLAHGIMLVFLFAPLHETIHKTAFRSPALNDGVARFCGAVLLLPPEYFRAFHFAHHRHTQDPANDPELAHGKPETLGAYLWHVSGLPYWAERIVTMVRHAAGRVDETFVAPRLRPAVVREARAYLAVYAAAALVSVLLQSTAVLWYWVMPVLLGQPFLRLYLLAEHTGCPFVANMLENSRTTRSLAAIRRLAWNMPYHAEHHAAPAVPFHALPAAHAVLGDRLAVTAPGYVAVHREILGDLRSIGAPAE